MSEWIRCSEQMPEKNTMVIVACYGSDIVVPQDGDIVEVKDEGRAWRP